MPNIKGLFTLYVPKFLKLYLPPPWLNNSNETRCKGNVVSVAQSYHSLKNSISIWRRRETLTGQEVPKALDLVQPITKNPSTAETHKETVKLQIINKLMLQTNYLNWKFKREDIVQIAISNIKHMVLIKHIQKGSNFAFHMTRDKRMEKSSILYCNENI